MTLLTMLDRETKDCIEGVIEQLADLIEEFPIGSMCNKPEIEINENGLEFTLKMNDINKVQSNVEYEEYVFHFKFDVNGRHDREKFDNAYPKHGDYQNLREE